jgi:hypothetical protein
LAASRVVPAVDFRFAALARLDPPRHEPNAEEWSNINVLAEGYPEMIAYFFQKRPQYSWPISHHLFDRRPSNDRQNTRAGGTPNHRNRLPAAVKANVCWMPT